VSEGAEIEKQDRMVLLPPAFETGADALQKVSEGAGIEK
jgi:hypothetical protein